MTVRGPGRLVVLASALAALPARRHPRFSAAMARIPATLRTLAMRHAPQLLVNGVGTGPIGDPLLAGDAAMLGHASIKRPGTIGEIIDPILFFCDPANTYTTGQFLLVDGGWSAGYARSF
jgi:NAD(P)-dependent dehydrogenase (short-subunit alcohol dehydrogenase family)